MGKKGGGCQLVGYGYTLTMIYAFCERADKISGWKVNGKIWWVDNALLTDDKTYSTYQQNLYTGKKGSVYHSDGSDHTNITFCLSDYTPFSYPLSNTASDTNFAFSNTKSIMLQEGIEHGSSKFPLAGDGSNTSNYLSSYIGYDIKLNNIAFAYMENAFVGDNTTTVPRYSARLSRFFINGKSHRVGIGSINPIAVIREIMQDFLKINQLDDTSFNDAYNICNQEGLGVAFVMTTEKKVKDWLKEILRTIDGVMWFDTVIGKWKIRLFRPATSDTTIFELSEENTSKIHITSGSWDTLVNDFTFKFSNILTGTTDSFSVSNSALFNILGYKVGKVYTYQLVGEYDIMAKIANRIIKKNSKPLSQLKARLSILDLPYIELGAIVKVASTKLDIQDQYFRIIKIGGDKEDDVYVDIEAIEEVWDVDYPDAIITNPPEVTDNGRSDISQIEPYIADIAELQNYFTEELYSNEQPVSSIVTYPKNYSNNYDITGVHKKFTYQGNELGIATHTIFYYGLLDGNFSVTGDAVNEAQSITIKPFSDSYCDIPEITINEEAWQEVWGLMLIGKELFSIKSVRAIDSVKHTYQISGIIRLTDKTEWLPYTDGTAVYIGYVGNMVSLTDFSSDKVGISVDLEAKYYNNYTKSQEKTANKTITGIARKLLSPDYNYVYENSNDNTLYLVFTKKARGGNTNANFRNTEYIKAGEKEDIGEETHLIIDYNGTTKTVILDTNLNSNVSVSNGLYTVNLTQEASDITLSNINRIKTQCVQQNYTLESDYVDVVVRN